MTIPRWSKVTLAALVPIVAGSIIAWKASAIGPLGHELEQYRLAMKSEKGSDERTDYYMIPRAPEEVIPYIQSVWREGAEWEGPARAIFRKRKATISFPDLDPNGSVESILDSEFPGVKRSSFDDFITGPSGSLFTGASQPKIRWRTGIVVKTRYYGGLWEQVKMLFGI